MNETQRYRLYLKFRVGRPLGTEETALTASLAGREVVIKSDRPSRPLSQASWLRIECQGFEAEDAARTFGEELRRAVHIAGLSARVGVDACDPGQDRQLGSFNPKAIPGLLESKPGMRIPPDIHGLQVLPDDGKTLEVRVSANLSDSSSADAFVEAIQEAFSASDQPEGDSTSIRSIRRAIRIMNLAVANADPIAKVVLAVSAIEGLATARCIDLEHGHDEEIGQVSKAIRRLSSGSTGQAIRTMLDSYGLSVLWPEWKRLYKKRSRLVHGGKMDGKEELSDHLRQAKLSELGHEASTLCGKIVIAAARREGIQMPSQAGLHFSIDDG